MLSTEAHWNQNEADWRFFLSKGIVFGMRDRKGNLVATAALLPYTERDAWISMVLVTENFRRRGLATRLVDTCLNAATKLGLTSWLDATPAGAPGLWSARLHADRSCCGGCVSPSTTASGERRIPPAGKFGDFLTCDINAMGFDRRDLLQELSGRAASTAGHDCRRHGAGPRRPHRAPCRSAVRRHDPAQALAIGARHRSERNGPLLIDAVATQDVFSNGLTTTAGPTSGRSSACALAARRADARASVRRRRPRVRIENFIMHHSEIKSEVRRLIADGTVLPAHPLALDADRKLDLVHQRALTRYYIDAGAGGLAVGVHTTQFAIRDVGLYRPVLELAAETAASWTKRPLALVAGLAGPTQQAVDARRRSRSASAITPACSASPR